MQIFKNINYKMGNDSSSDDEKDDRKGGSGNKDPKGGPGGNPGPIDPPDQHFNYNEIGGGSGVGTIHNYQYIYD